MQKILLKNGVATGAVAIGGIIVSIILFSGSDSLQYLEGIGYVIMFAALSLIFFGIRKHRDENLSGSITFMQGLAMGLGMTAIATIVYIVGWEIYLSLTDYSFIDQYTQAEIEKARESGITGAGLEERIASIEAMKEQYAKPVIRFLFTSIEIFPAGLLVTIASAAMLRKTPNTNA